MCGIWLLLLKSNDIPDYYNAFKTVKSRGPDRSHITEFNAPYNIVVGFHRLSIMDTSTKADQPFVYEYYKNDEKRIVICICNGEIYNFRELTKKHNLSPVSGSDCEIIHLLYLKIGFENLLKEIIGEFAIILIDTNTEGDMTLYATRDPFGVKPLCMTITKNYINFSSELKGLINVHNNNVLNNEMVNMIQPSHYIVMEKKIDWSEPKTIRYYSCANVDILVKSMDSIKYNIRNILTECVRCRLVADRPLGCLLSGGLDSSLVASIASRLLKAEGRQLSTFSIGMNNGTDEMYALMVAKHIGSNHTHIDITPQKALTKALNIVCTTETFDITTNRASVPQTLACEWISENTDIKVLLIGDGMDEVGGGYRYHSKAPTVLDSHNENIRLLEDISHFDVKRADMGVSSNGLEARVPYLDIRFTEYYLSVDPELRDSRNRIEKWLLRESFNNLNYLPPEVLFRRKEAFSDGISSVENSWYTMLQTHMETVYSDEEFIMKQEEYKHCVPPTKEALYYREMYKNFFGNNTCHIVPYYWLPKWCGDISEPSARVLHNYGD